MQPELTSSSANVVTTSTPVIAPEAEQERALPSAPASEQARMAEIQENTDETVEWREVDESREISSLPKGCYLVVGAFQQSDNAIRYLDAVSQLGYKAETAYDEATKFNYVYINKAAEAKYLHAQRDAVRNKNILYFPEAWILEIR